MKMTNSSLFLYKRSLNSHGPLLHQLLEIIMSLSNMICIGWKIESDSTMTQGIRKIYNAVHNSFMRMQQSDRNNCHVSQQTVSRSEAVSSYKIRLEQNALKAGHFK